MAFTAEEEAALRELLDRVDVSQTLQNLYLSDPILANNTKLKLLLGGYSVADGKDFGCTEQQLIAIIAPLLGTSPPVEEEVSAFIVTINDNTLIANINPVTGIDYDYWIDTVNDDVEPVFPTGFTQGTAPTNKTLSTWVAEIWHRYVYNTVTSTLTEILRQDGGRGITITPVDSIVDIAVTDLTLIAGANAPTQIIYEFDTGADNGTGIDHYDLCFAGTQTELVTAAVRGTPTTVSSLVPLDANEDANVYSLWVRITDVAGNVSLETKSLTVDITMGAPLEITAFSVDDDTDGAPFTSTVNLTLPAGMDEIILQISDSTTPSDGSSSWAAAPADITFTGLGVYDVYAWGRDATFPTGISPMESALSVAVTDAGASGVILQFAETSSTISEEGAPAHAVEITRSNVTAGAVSCTINATAATDVPTAVAGENYQPISNIEIAIADSVITVDQIVDILYNRIPPGQSLAFDLTLSAPVGATLGSNTVHRVTIQPTNGYWSTGDVDWNYPPALPISGAISPASSSTVSGFKIDGGAISNICVNLTGTTGVTIENCEITNARNYGVFLQNTQNLTLRNCYIHDNWAGDVFDRLGYNIMFDGQSTTDIQNIDILGNRMEWSSGGIRLYLCKTMSDVVIENNHMVDAIRHSNEGQHLFATNCSWGTTPPVFRRNKSIFSVNPLANGEDHINFFKSGKGSGGTPAIIELNYFKGQSLSNGSGATFLVGDNARNLAEGNSLIKYNTSIESGVTGMALMGGADQKCHYNDGWMPPDSIFVVKGELPGNSAVGGVMQRSVQTPRGEFDDAEFGGNRMCWYTDFNTGAGAQLNNYWRPNIGADGFTPNHGTYADPVSAETDVIGFDDSQTNISMHDGTNQFSENWTTSGDMWVQGRHEILTQPAIDEGIEVMYSSQSCPVGNGILTYIDSTTSVTFQAYGESAGAAVDISTPEWDDGTEDNDTWHVFSSSGAYVRILVTAASLPGADTNWTIKVTRFEKDEVILYPGVTGLWTGSTGTTPPAGNDPTVPVITDPIPAGTITEDTIVVDCSASTASPAVGGYEWFRNDVSIQTTAGQILTDTGLTGGTTYEYKVRAFDTADPVRFSSLSDPVAATTDAVSGGELFNEEFTANSTEPDETTGWDALNATPSPIIPTQSGTVFEVVNATTATASIYQEKSTLDPAKTYTVTVGHKRGTGNTTGKVVINNTGSGRIGTGNQVTDTLSESVIESFTEYEYTGVAPKAVTGEIWVILWNVSSNSGDSTHWDYCRFREEP